VTVRLHSGNTAVEKDSKVNVVPSFDLSVTTGCHDNTLIIQEVARGGSCDWEMTLLQEPLLTDGTCIDKKVSCLHCLINAYI